MRPIIFLNYIRQKREQNGIARRVKFEYIQIDEKKKKTDDQVADHQ
jgi:hypothetical protein